MTFLISRLSALNGIIILVIVEGAIGSCVIAPYKSTRSQIDITLNVCWSANTSTRNIHTTILLVKWKSAPFIISGTILSSSNSEDSEEEDVDDMSKVSSYR